MSLRFRLSLAIFRIHVMRSACAFSRWRACVRKYKPMGQKVYACARVYYSTVFSQIHMLCDEFFSKTIEVHCACIHYHSHTYIRHRDIASLLPRHTSVNA